MKLWLLITIILADLASITGRISAGKWTRFAEVGLGVTHVNLVLDAVWDAIAEYERRTYVPGIVMEVGENNQENYDLYRRFVSTCKDEEAKAAGTVCSTPYGEYYYALDGTWKADKVLSERGASSEL